jgi:hypothetical protein
MARTEKALMDREAVTFALPISAGSIGEKVAWGDPITAVDELSSFGQNALFALLMSGWHGGIEGETFIDPATGKKIAVPGEKGLKQVNPEAYEFYKKSAKRKFQPIYTKRSGIYTWSTLAYRKR